MKNLIVRGTRCSGCLCGGERVIARTLHRNIGLKGVKMESARIIDIIFAAARKDDFRDTLLILSESGRSNSEVLREFLAETAKHGVKITADELFAEQNESGPFKTLLLEVSPAKPCPPSDNLEDDFWNELECQAVYEPCGIIPWGVDHIKPLVKKILSHVEATRRSQAEGAIRASRRGGFGYPNNRPR